MSTKYVARVNGEIVGKRTTKDRTYTHAVVVAKPTVKNYYFGKNSPEHELLHVAAWAGRLDLAQRAVRRWADLYETVEIVPAERVLSLEATIWKAELNKTA